MGSDMQPHPDWPTQSFRAMGGSVALWLDTPDRKRAASAFGVARQMFGYAEQTFSRFDPDSELSRLNASAGRMTPVSDLMWEMLGVALSAAHQTDGMFDPTLGNALRGVGYDRTFKHVAERGTFEMNSQRAASQGGWREIIREAESQSVLLPEGSALDFGGIAKGYTASLVVDLLSAVGPSLVSAAGDVVAAGAPHGLPGWPVTIAAPHPADRDAVFLWLADAALATSGVDRRNWQTDRGPAHHLIDPRIGASAAVASLTATVLHHDAAQAELLAKLALIAPEHLPPETAVLFFETHDQLHYSPAMSAHIAWADPALAMQTQGVL